MKRRMDMKKIARFPKSSRTVRALALYGVPDEAVFAVLGKTFHVCRTHVMGAVTLAVRHEHPAHGYRFPKEFVL